jgi:hypothetical protein
MIDLDMPTFLRIPQEVRRESWRGRKLTKPKVVSVKITRNEDDAGVPQGDRKTGGGEEAIRFAMLRERVAEKKRQSLRPAAKCQP